MSPRNNDTNILQRNSNFVKNKREASRTSQNGTEQAFGGINNYFTEENCGIRYMLTLLGSVLPRRSWPSFSPYIGTSSACQKLTSRLKRAGISIFREVKLLQRLLNSNSQVSGRTDYGVVAFVQEACYFHMCMFGVSAGELRVTAHINDGQQKKRSHKKCTFPHIMNGSKAGGNRLRLFNTQGSACVFLNCFANMALGIKNNKMQSLFLVGICII